jgi:chromate transport protein ChrA
VTAASRRDVAIAAVADVASIVTFVAIGRRSHDESGSVLEGIAKVAAPFLIALVAAWAVSRAWTSPWSIRTGIVIWPVTVAVGMVLRHTLFDRSTATSFIIVTAIVTGVFLVGWRALAALVRRQARTASSPSA